MHFTYEAPDDTQLKQGDVLQRTTALETLLQEVHPHYVDDKYTHFQVLTQSCDLFRRGKETRCKARYITLAAVRKLSDVINRFLEGIPAKVSLEGVTHCSQNQENKIAEKLRGIFNNNNNDYFFKSRARLWTARRQLHFFALVDCDTCAGSLRALLRI